MNFEPANKFLQVIPLDEAEEVSDITIVLPTDYQAPQSPYVVCEVIKIAKDSKFYSSFCDFEGDPTSQREKIIAERRMLHKIDFNGETIYLILENYVFGRLEYEINETELDNFSAGGSSRKIEAS